MGSSWRKELQTDEPRLECMRCVWGQTQQTELRAAGLTLWDAQAAPRVPVKCRFPGPGVRDSDLGGLGGPRIGHA